MKAAPVIDTGAAQFVKKHAYGGFFDEFAPFAYEPSARRAANGDRNPLLRKGSETTGRVSEANRGARTAQSAPAEPKPKPNQRLGLGRNTCRWFRFGNWRAAALQYLHGFFDSQRGHGICRGLWSSKNTPAAAVLTSYAPFAYEPSARRAANGDRNPLLRKGSETTAHVAGFGFEVRGLRPDHTS